MKDYWGRELDRWDEACEVRIAEIKSRYPDESHMTEEEERDRAHEIYQAYRDTLPKTIEEWLEHLGDFACLSCERYCGILDSGTVVCKDIVTYISRGVTVSPLKAKGTQFRRPHGWVTGPDGKRRANCEDYKKAKGQSKLNI